MNNWIDAEIINYPYSKPIEVCTYYCYCNDGSRALYMNKRGTIIVHDQMKQSSALDLVYKWKLCPNLKINGLTLI